MSITIALSRKWVAKSDLPKPIVEELRKSQEELCRAWNEMYPGNPVRPRKRAQ